MLFLETEEMMDGNVEVKDLKVEMLGEVRTEVNYLEILICSHKNQDYAIDDDTEWCRAASLGEECCCLTTQHC